MNSSTALKKVSIVVPVFNEKDNLSSLLEELKTLADKHSTLEWEWILVDDGSKDGSGDLLFRLTAQYPALKVVQFVRNFGQTAAMSCGIELASGDVIVPMDADLQNDPADIPAFLELLNQGYDCVSGWRKQRQDDFISRKLPSWLANAMISKLTDVDLHDYGCSLKAYRRELIQGVSLYGEMHRFIPAYVAWSGGRVTELVVNHRPRLHGVSKYGISRVFKVILDLMVVKFLTVYFNKPMHVFGGVGFICLFLGGLAELFAVYLKLFAGRSFIQTPLPTVGAIFIIIGVQLILTGLLAEVLMRTYYETQRKRPYQIRRQS